MNISEFRREGQASGVVEPSGKIELGAHEIPTVPSDDPAYAGGLRIELEGVTNHAFPRYRCVPHPSGNRIDLSWVTSTPDAVSGRARRAS